MLSLWLWAPAKAQKSYTLESPNSRLSVVISVDDSVRFSLYKDGAEIVSPSKIGLTLKTLQESEQLFVGAKVAKPSARRPTPPSLPSVIEKTPLRIDTTNCH